MLTEDINRPPAFRFAERVFFFTKKIKTTGIMQVTSKKKLSDEESIELAQKIILSSYNKNKTLAKDEYDLVAKIAQDYNGGGYGGEVTVNYSFLENSTSN